MARPYLMLFLCVFIWAANYIVRQILLHQFSPFFLSGFSLTIVFLVFFVWAVGSKSLVRLERKEWILFALQAAIGLVANQLFLFGGLKYSTATNASLMFSLSPLITAGLAAVFLKENITRRMIFGSIIAICGLFLVLQLEGEYLFHFGDLLLFGATFTFSCNLIFVRILSRRLSPFIIQVYSFAISAVLYDPFMLAGATIDWHHPLFIWGLAFLSVIVAQGLTGVMWNKAMDSVGAAKSAIVLNLQPLMTMFLDFLFFHHTVTLQQLLGAALVFGGILLGTIQKERLNQVSEKTTAS